MRAGSRSFWDTHCHPGGWRLRFLGSCCCALNSFKELVLQMVILCQGLTMSQGHRRKVEEKRVELHGKEITGCVQHTAGYPGRGWFDFTPNTCLGRKERRGHLLQHFYRLPTTLSFKFRLLYFLNLLQCSHKLWVCGVCVNVCVCVFIESKRVKKPCLEGLSVCETVSM